MLWEKSTYLVKVPYIISVPIYEYDISNANISILFTKQAISAEQYRVLYNMDKHTRVVSVGLMEKENPLLSKIKLEGIKEARGWLCSSNNISDNEILSIKNDAIYVIGRKLRNTRMSDHIEFILKNQYTSYMKLKNLEVYFRYDMLSGREILDVKGIADKTLPLHAEGMCAILADILVSLEYGDLNQAIAIFNNYYNQYLNRQLPIQFYREFNAGSRFVVNAGYGIYGLNTVEDINAIDISYNMNMLRDLYSHIMSIYFSKIKK